DAIEELAIEQIADNIDPARFFHVQVVNLPASLSDGSKDILIDPRLLDSTVILRGGPDVQHWKQIVRRKRFEPLAEPFRFSDIHMVLDHPMMITYDIRRYHSADQRALQGDKMALCPSGPKTK